MRDIFLKCVPLNANHIFAFAKNCLVYEYFAGIMHPSYTCLNPSLLTQRVNDMSFIPVCNDYLLLAIKTKIKTKIKPVVVSNNQKNVFAKNS